MTQQTIEFNQTGTVARGVINSNFSELYAARPSFGFPNNAERDNFFTGASNAENLTLLRTGIIIVVGAGTDTAALQQWKGGNSPSTYDNTQWSRADLQVFAPGTNEGDILKVSSTGILEPSAITETDTAVVFDKEGRFPPGSALLGELRLSDNVNALGIETSSGDQGVLAHQVVTTSGGQGLKDYEFLAQVEATLNSTEDTTLPANFSFTYSTTSGNPSATHTWTKELAYKPAQAGSLRVEVFLGTDATGSNIYDSTFTFTQAHVDSGNFVFVDVGNRLLFQNNTDIFIRYSGIQLKGGVGAPGEFLAGVQAPALQVRSSPAIQHTVLNDSSLKTNLLASANTIHLRSTGSATASGTRYSDPVSTIAVALTKVAEFADDQHKSIRSDEVYTYAEDLTVPENEIHIFAPGITVDDFSTGGRESFVTLRRVGDCNVGSNSIIRLQECGDDVGNAVRFSAGIHARTNVKIHRVLTPSVITFANATGRIHIEVDDYVGNIATMLATIPSGLTVTGYVGSHRFTPQADWNETDTSSPSFINNKPVIPARNWPTKSRRSSATFDSDELYSHVIFDGSSGAATYTLPNASTTGFGDGVYTYIRSTSSSANATLAAGSGVTIDGSTTIAPGEFFLLIWEAVEGANDIVHVELLNGSGGGVTVQDEGTPLATEATTLNFTGAGVTASGTGTTKTINIPGGAGGTPTLVDVTTTSHTLTSAVADQTYVNVTTTGSALTTVNTPTVNAGLLGKRITVTNNRVNGTVRVNLDGTDEIYNAFVVGQLDLLVGESVTLIATVAGRWSLVAQGDVTVTPNFPSNAENDDNTFFFQVNGDSPTTWMRDMNTRIDMRSNNSNVAYELANPSTSGITVENEDGYIFRHTTGSNNVQIFPFAGSNRFFIGATEYTRMSPYTLPLGSSIVVIYNTTTSRWEGRIFNFLVGSGAGGSSGSSGGTGSSISNQIFVSCINEDTATLNKGDAVIVEAKDGQIAMVKAGNGSVANGYLLEETGINNSGQVVRFGIVDSLNIYESTSLINAPLSQNTEVFYNSTDGRTQTDSEGGVHTSVGKVLSSAFLYPENANTSNPIIDSQAEWDAWHSKTQRKNYGGSGIFEIPDIAEGSAEVTVTPGQQFIVYLPQGNGTLSIRPRGASTIRSEYPGTNPVYTNASPLGMTGVANAEYIIIEVDSAGTGYLYYRLNESGIRTEFLFDWTMHLQSALSAQVFHLTTVTNTNSANINTLRYPNIIPIVVDTYTLSFPRFYYAMSNRTGVATVNIKADWSELGVNKSSYTVLDNRDNTQWVKVVNLGGNFGGMTTDTIFVAPGEYREFILLFTNASSVTPRGRVSYPLVAKKGLLSAIWILDTDDMNDLPTDVIEVPAAQQQRVQFKYPGKIENLRLDMSWLFTGTAAADFASLAVLHPGVEIRKNGASHELSHDANVLNIANGRDQMHKEYGHMDIASNDYIDLLGSDLTDVTGSTITLRGDYIVKE